MVGIFPALTNYKLMKNQMFKFETVISVSLILWASLCSGSTEKPMKSPMSYILNQVINAESQNEKLEAEPILMKNYQLFVYVGSSCVQCTDFLSALNSFANKYRKLVNVVLIYDYSSKKLQDSKAQFAQSAAFEFFDEKGYLYHTLFYQPKFLDYVFTGPKHTVLSTSSFVESKDIAKLEAWLIQNN